MSATSEQNETQVSITTPDGRTTELGSLSEFERNADEAVRRLRGEQLSFQVGLPGNRPDFGSVKIGGSLGVSRDLLRQQEVVVTVALADGTVIASGPGKVTAIGFKDSEDKYGLVTTERIHTINI